jgi:hypothetical protein
MARFDLGQVLLFFRVHTQEAVKTCVRRTRTSYTYFIRGPVPDKIRRHRPKDFGEYLPVRTCSVVPELECRVCQWILDEFVQLSLGVVIVQVGSGPHKAGDFRFAILG